MSDPYSLEGLYDALYAAQAERAAITAKSQPLRDQRDKLLAQMAPQLEQERALIRQYKALEVPLFDLDAKIAALSKAVSGKRDPRKAKPAEAVSPS